MKPSRRVAVALTLIICLAGVGASLSLANAGSRHQSRDHYAARARATTKFMNLFARRQRLMLGHTAVSPILIKHFRLIRSALRGKHRTQLAASEVPTPIAHIINANVSGPAANQWVAGTSLVIPVTATGWVRPVWVVPGNSGVCIFTLEAVNQASGTCQPSSVALSSGVGAFIQANDGAETIFGLVPDGFRVSAVNGNGVNRSLPTANNAYEDNSQSGFTSITTNDGVGTNLVERYRP